MGIRDREGGFDVDVEAARRADGETTPDDRRRMAVDTHDGLDQGSHDAGRPANMNLIYNNPEQRETGRRILDRYTGTPPEGLPNPVPLTNLEYLPERTGRMSDDVGTTRGSAMTARHSEKLGVSLINFSVGSPVAALIIEVLATAEPKATLFLGMCGGLHRSLKVGDFILP